MINEMEWMDRIHMLILQTCDLIFFLIAVIILILFCVCFICIFDSVCVFFYFIVSLSIFCLFVLCLKNSNESRIHEAMSACMAKIISHITELLFGTSPKKIYAMWPFQGRENDHQILFSTFHQSYQNHRISFNFAVFRSFNRNT